MEIKIIYGSDTGNTEDITNMIVDLLMNDGLEIGTETSSASSLIGKLKKRLAKRHFKLSDLSKNGPLRQLLKN